MLTDSGGYQIFSMGHGSVGDEIKGRRGAEGGAEFCEFVTVKDLEEHRAGSGGGRGGEPHLWIDRFYDSRRSIFIS